MRRRWRGWKSIGARRSLILLDVWMVYREGTKGANGTDATNAVEMD